MLDNLEVVQITPRFGVQLFVNLYSNDHCIEACNLYCDGHCSVYLTSDMHPKQCIYVMTSLTLWRQIFSGGFHKQKTVLWSYFIMSYSSRLTCNRHVGRTITDKSLIITRTSDITRTSHSDKILRYFDTD